jgi:uncharacterized CHY-type Zn-finger protein
MSIYVKGKPIDSETRCVHYRSPLDIIAIKFKCCNEYYPCFECHEETAEHVAMRWPKAEWDAKAILCGHCKSELSIHEYLNSQNRCPVCKSNFNPGCEKHYHLYFEDEKIDNPIS